MEEWFDVVDRNDTAIGRASREQVHREGLLHRSTHLLVFDNSGRVLLQKRSMCKDKYPDRWDSSVSGHVDSGEEYDQCIMREAKEEIGIELETTPEKLFKIDACDETDQEFTWVYRTVSEGPFAPNDKEISKIAWLTRNDVSRLMEANPERVSPSFAFIWNKLHAKS
tara:strand:+ start:58 stop:558 length:501 start_codon:yes stop_codon:yes gene_type:complete